MNTVLTKVFSAPELNRREILRYAGVGDESVEICNLLDECINEAMPLLSYRVCYAEYDVSDCDKELNIGFCT